MPPQQPTRIRLCLADDQRVGVLALRRNHVWKCDFAVVHTADGRAVRMLVVIDEFTRECLKMVVAGSLGSKEVLEALWGLFVARGIPEYIRPDNGPEFAGQAVRQWLARVGVKTLLIEAGSPRENGHDGLFVGKMREELLNREIFETFQEARALMGRGGNDQPKPRRAPDVLPPLPQRGALDAVSGQPSGLVPSLRLNPPDPGSRDAAAGGNGRHDDPRRARGAAGGYAPSVPRQAEQVGAVAGTEDRQADRHDAPVGEAEGHDAPRAEGEDSEDRAVPAHPLTQDACTGIAVETQAGGPRDIRPGSPEETELLRRGAERGLSGFQLELGERYAKGIKGVSRNHAEARRWLTKALQDPEFPEHADQAAALLDQLKHGARADSGRGSSRAPSAAGAHLGRVKAWHIVAAVVAVAVAVLLWMN